MLIIIGALIVVIGVFGGYKLEGGNLHVLYQPAELVIIGGAALGSFIISCPKNLLIKILSSVKGLFSSHTSDKAEYLELLDLLYNIFLKINREGLLSIETHIEEPEKSDLFNKYKKIFANHHVIKFICDNLRVFATIGLGDNPMVFDEMMTTEIDAHHEESASISGNVTKLAESFPGLGIVAAVMGVVIVMGKMNEGPEVIGHGVAAALVGTFLGILLCYGFVAPIGNLLEYKAKEDSKLLEVIKVSLIAFTSGLQPLMAVEFGRRVIFSDAKPSFKELEETVRKKKT